MPSKKSLLTPTTFLVFLFPLALPALFVVLLVPAEERVKAQERSPKRGELPEARSAPRQADSAAFPRQAGANLRSKSDSSTSSKTPLRPAGKLAVTPRTATTPQPRPEMLARSTGNANRTPAKKPVMQANRAASRPEVPEASLAEAPAASMPESTTKPTPATRPTPSEPLRRQRQRTASRSENLVMEQPVPPPTIPPRPPVVVQLDPEDSIADVASHGSELGTGRPLAGNKHTPEFVSEQTLPVFRTPTAESRTMETEPAAFDVELVAAPPASPSPLDEPAEFVSEQLLPTPTKPTRPPLVADFEADELQQELLPPPSQINDESEAVRPLFDPPPRRTPPVAKTAPKTLPVPEIWFEEEPPEPQMEGVDQAFFEEESTPSEPIKATAPQQTTPQQLVLEDQPRQTPKTQPDVSKSTQPPEPELAQESNDTANLLAHLRPVSAITLQEAVQLPPVAEGDSPNVVQPSNQALAFLQRRHAINVGSGPWNIWQSYRDSMPFCHYPLYFEDPNLERCGHGWGPLTTAASYGHFVANVPILPYRVGAEPPHSRVRTLPDCAACERFGLSAYLPPWSWAGAATQAAATVGLIYLVP